MRSFHRRKRNRQKTRVQRGQPLSALVQAWLALIFAREFGAESVKLKVVSSHDFFLGFIGGLGNCENDRP